MNVVCGMETHVVHRERINIIIVNSQREKKSTHRIALIVDFFFWHRVNIRMRLVLLNRVGGYFVFWEIQMDSYSLESIITGSYQPGIGS